MRSSFITGVLTAVSVIWALLANAQQPAPVIHEFTVQQAVDYSLKNNVQVKNALLAVRIQQETNRDITSAAFPQIKATGSMIDNIKIPVSLVPGEFFGAPAGTFIPIAFGVKYNATAGIELNQLLFDGQVFVGLQARRTSILFREKNVEVTQENIKANIYKIYYQLAVSGTQIDLLNANIERFDKLLKDTREIHKNGFAEKLDVDKISVQLANLQTEKEKALTSITNGYIGLKLLMGMPIRDSLVLTDSLNDDQIKEGLLAVDSLHYGDRKEYQYAELGVRLNKYNIQRYKLSRLPTLSLDGYYNKNAQRNDFTFFKGGPDGNWFSISAITLRLTIPIFTGFSAQAKIKQAELELQQSINQREDLKLTIDRDIEVAKNNFRSAAFTLDYQKQNMQLAESVLDQTRKKFESGIGSNTEITTAQTDLKTAQTNYINAVYDAIIARVDYLKATGKL